MEKYATGVLHMLKGWSEKNILHSQYNGGEQKSVCAAQGIK